MGIRDGGMVEWMNREINRRKLEERKREAENEIQYTPGRLCWNGGRRIAFLKNVCSG